MKRSFAETFSLSFCCFLKDYKLTSHNSGVEIWSLLLTPEYATNNIKKLFIKKYGSTSYLRIAQVLKWQPIHKV